MKVFLVPKDVTYKGTTSDIPDFLVTDSMSKRFMQIEPPIAMVLSEYQDIIDEIEKTYVLGYFFSALSSACVAIERTLNLARIRLHKHHQIIKELLSKEATNDWEENINALNIWGYIDDEFAKELSSIYKDVRCSYMHSGDRYDYEADALRCITAAYRLMNIFIGFPDDLFNVNQGMFQCSNIEDPRCIEFYKSAMIEIPEKDDNGNDSG